MSGPTAEKGRGMDWEMPVGAQPGGDGTRFRVWAENAQRVETVLVDICEEAAKHGIGVIVASDPGDFDTWNFREDAARTEPDPSKLNEFIQAQLSQGTRDQILTWLK